jgi:hypothetical protein
MYCKRVPGLRLSRSAGKGRVRQSTDLMQKIQFKEVCMEFNDCSKRHR